MNKQEEPWEFIASSSMGGNIRKHWESGVFTEEDSSETMTWTFEMVSDLVGSTASWAYHEGKNSVSPISLRDLKDQLQALADQIPDV